MKKVSIQLNEGIIAFLETPSYIASKRPAWFLLLAPNTVVRS
jgi:hypothetical protein